MTPEQTHFLENKLTEIFQEAIEILSIDQDRDGLYNAYICFDGINDRANKGHVYFTCRPINDKVEDFCLKNFTGRYYSNPPTLDNDTP